MMYKVPLSVPSIRGNEWKYIKECLDTEWVSSAGKYVDLFEEIIADFTGVSHAIACVNGTAALQVALRLAGVEPGDEVIVPTLTFISPVNAVSYNGATPVFMDADEYYNIDVKKSISFIKKNTTWKNGFTYNKTTRNRISAIVPVHVWGNACWMDELVELCNERNITIVEDAAESMGTRYTSGKFKGRHTGSIGKLGCLSFNGNKIITTGGGGMILTDDEQLADKARYLTTQAKDDPLRYIHHEIGYNFRLTNMQAALGVAQLEQLSGFLERKSEIFYQYQTGLNDVDGLTVVSVPDYADNNHWMNLLQIDNTLYKKGRKALMQKLEGNSIQTRPVWYPNHLQKPYENCQAYRIENVKNLVDNSLCLPSSNKLGAKDIEQIVAVLHG